MSGNDHPCITRSARFGIHVGRIVACVRLRPHAALLRPAARRHTWAAGVGPCMGSVLGSFTPVRHRSPASTPIGLRSSRTVADAGERGPTLLESVLGATLRSSNLLSSATSDQAICQTGHAFGFGLQGCVVSFCSLVHSTHIGIKRPKMQAHALVAVAVVAVTMGEDLPSDSAGSSLPIRNSYPMDSVRESRCTESAIMCRRLQPASGFPSVRRRPRHFVASSCGGAPP
jgi:hypothetical protein